MLGALALPGTAFGATADLSGATLTVQAAGGEENDVVVETDPPVFRVIDNSAPLTAGAACSQRSVHRVSCPAAGVTLVRVLAGDGDDTVLTLIGTTEAELNGGTGSDTLTGSEGDDTLRSGKSGNGFQESLSGAGGQDTLIGSPGTAGAVSMNGGFGSDQLLGGFGQESLTGGPGPDLIQGGPGFDFLFYFSASSGLTITAGAGANDGEAGENDFVAADIENYFGSPFNDSFTGGPLDENFNANAGNDVVAGGGGDDNVRGGDNADTLSGGGGDDFLEGGKRADDISGGLGLDFADYDEQAAAVSVTINDVANDGSGGGAEGDNVHTDVENLRGSDFNDLLIGSADDNQIIGGDGDDNLQGNGGDDELIGDTQFSTFDVGSDDLGGGDGEDTLRGGPGPDDFSGGPDYDFVDYSSPFFGIQPDLFITIDNVADDGPAGEGDNVMDTVEGVIGGSGDDTMTGSNLANSLFGGDGDDVIHGANGADLLDGEAPPSSGVFGADTLDGGQGNDTVTYRSHGFVGVQVDIGGGLDGSGAGAEGDDVQSTVENLIGTETNDTLTGNDQANTIRGRDGADLLVGGAGPDHLAGDGGGDTHEGQAGKDEINSRGDGTFDTDNCGSEADVAIRDAIDNVNNCETVIG